MTVSTDELFIILIGAGGNKPDTYAFCVNRRIDDIAPCIANLRQVDGVRSFAKAEASVDNDGNLQTIVEIIFEGCCHMPSVFGRIAAAFADYLEVPHNDTLLFREPTGSDKDDDDSPLTFMRLTDYGVAFPETFPGSAEYVNEVMDHIEKSMRSA